MFRSNTLIKILPLLAARYSFCVHVDCSHHTMTALFEYSGSRAWKCSTLNQHLTYSKLFALFENSIDPDQLDRQLTSTKGSHTLRSSYQLPYFIQSKTENNIYESIG